MVDTPVLVSQEERLPPGVPQSNGGPFISSFFHSQQSHFVVLFLNSKVCQFCGNLLMHMFLFFTFPFYLMPFVAEGNQIFDSNNESETGIAEEKQIATK